MAPLCPWSLSHTRGRRWHKAHTGCVTSPLKLFPGLVPPRALERAVGTATATTNNRCRNSIGWGQMEQGHPGSGRPFNAGSVLFLANFLARALASERRLYAFLITGLDVKGVALHFFNNVFLLYFALEAAQSILKGFTLLQSDFRQTDTPPNPSRWTE